MENKIEIPDITPEWDKIPKEYNYVAIDSDGGEFVYKGKPVAIIDWSSENCWFSTGRVFDMSNIDWTKTVSERPKNKEINMVDNKEKTILEWFQEAKEQGFEWADLAIANTYQEVRDLKAQSIKSALLLAFVWHLSPQKSDFWSDIAEQIEKQEIKKEMKIETNDTTKFKVLQCKSVFHKDLLYMRFVLEQVSDNDVPLSKIKLYLKPSDSKVSEFISSMSNGILIENPFNYA